MSVKFKDEINYIAFDNLMEEDVNVDFELSCLVSNIKKEVVKVFDLFFLKRNMNKTYHNMFSLMLDPRFKSLCLVSSFISHE
jgi:hypothetical protein